MIAPVLSQIASERDITIAKVNTDVNPLSPGRFGVRGIRLSSSSIMVKSLTE